MKDIVLDGSWECACIDAYGTLPKDKRGATKWMPAEVPGTIHTDLMKQKLIADPFVGTNENDVQWVDTVKWSYRKTFTVPNTMLDETTVDLVADGLDTYAEIFCNGKKVGETSNMFVGHRLPVKKFLRAGKNELTIIFDSPTRRSLDLEKLHGQLLVANDPHRVFVRKAQYSFGWDWGPHLTTSGIWRSIKLQAHSKGRLDHPFARTVAVSATEATVTFSVDVLDAANDPLTVHAFIGGAATAGESTAAVTDGKAVFTVRIPDPQLWWPNGHGAQPMYSVVFSLRHGEEEIDSAETPFAIRTVKLLQENDEEGRSFIIEINGRKIFCKGADWIPSDNFIPRIPDTTYERLLTHARDAHMNMMRVWGGGIYEQDIFYDLCDRLGLMVWQDFMFACGEYPRASWFTDQVKDEAVKVVRRLRNHPSIVAWCGNNESEWMFATEYPAKTVDDMHGAEIFSTLLPAVCAKEDGTRIYWRSSPFGEGFPNAESNGTHHQWIVWSFWKDYKEYAKDTARFVSEFGFQAPANRETFERVVLPRDRFPQSEVMEHHNKQVEGTERLYRFRAAHYRVTESFDDFIYHGQLVQAEALKFAVEHWRRRKYRTAGTLFWQLNDCWPVSSWAVIDSSLTPKAGYYFSKKFYAPVLVSLKASAESVDVWLTNDAATPVRGTLAVELLTMTGKTVWRTSKKIAAGGDTSQELDAVPMKKIAGWDGASHYLRARLEVAGIVVAENRHYFKEPKHLQLPAAKVTYRIVNDVPGCMTIAVTSPKLAKNVRLEAAGGGIDFSDNYFDIDAGGTVLVTLATTQTRASVKKNLRLRSLA